MAKAQADLLQSLVGRLREMRKQAGGRLGHVLADASVRERAAAVADKLEDLRVELTRSLRHARPAAAPAKPAAAPAKPAAARAKPAAAPAKPAARPPAKPAPKRPVKALDDMTVQELRHLATKRHIAGRSSMNKAELVEALGKK
jgi:Rho termination factor-like protein